MSSSSLAIAFISLFLVVCIAIMLYIQQYKIKEDWNDKLVSLVNQINESQMYEFKFDKLQDQNIKNMDMNYTAMYDAIVNLQNNVRHLQYVVEKNSKAA